MVESEWEGRREILSELICVYSEFTENFFPPLSGQLFLRGSHCCTVHLLPRFLLIVLSISVYIPLFRFSSRPVCSMKLFVLFYIGL